MKAVTGRVYTGTKATLNHYAVFRVRGTAYPGILAEEGASVEGTLYRGITEDVIQLLDQFEGPQYHRKILKISPDKRQEIDAYVYCIRDNCARIRSRDRWDFSRFLKDEIDLFLKDLSSG